MALTRDTLQKKIVYETVTSMHSHPSADEVYCMVQKKHDSISKATVYRILGNLAEAGRIQRVRVFDGADRFDFNISSHYHMKCLECGRVFDAEIPYLDALPEKLTNLNGFKICSCTVLFEGFCTECMQRKDVDKIIEKEM